MGDGYCLAITQLLLWIMSYWSTAFFPNELPFCHRLKTFLLRTVFNEQGARDYLFIDAVTLMVGDPFTLSNFFVWESL